MTFFITILILAGIIAFDSTNSTKLKLLHRDRNGNYIHRFQQSTKHDAKRVANLIYSVEQFAFEGEVISSLNEGIGEYLIPIGIGSLPTTQHVIMDTKNDLIWVQCQKCQQCYSQSDPNFQPSTIF